MGVLIIADHRVFGRLAAKARYNCNWDPMAYPKTVPINLPYHNRGLEWLVCQILVLKRSTIEYDNFQSLGKESSTEEIR